VISIPVLPAIERVLLTLWVGGLWVSGLAFAPTLFANFDRQLAGDVAGRLFSSMSQVGLVCGFVLLVLALHRSSKRFWRDWQVVVLATMLVILLVGEYGVATRMRELKALAILQDNAAASLWSEFGRLHVVSSTLYLIECVLGLVLVVSGLRPRVQAGN